MNLTDACQHNDSIEMSNFSSSSVSFTTEVIVTGTNSASIVVCLLATHLVFRFHLQKAAVYRLALYQVLASLAFATVEVSQIVFVNYKKNASLYDDVCLAIGWLTIYTRWVKLIFTAWLTFHLFCFAVLHKNFKKLEVLYVVFSLVLPVPMATVPLITGTYGVDKIGVCYFFAKNDTNHVATIEKFSLWYGPAIVILFVSSFAMMAMMVKVACRVCGRRSQYELIRDGDQYWRALKQLLPLSIFPVLFFVFMIPVFVSGISLAANPSPNKALSFSATLFISLWSMSSGLTLIIHISVVRCLARRKRSDVG